MTCVSMSSLSCLSNVSVSIPVCLFLEERPPFFLGLAFFFTIAVSIGSSTSGYFDCRKLSETVMPRTSGTSCGESHVTKGVVPGV